MALGKGKVNVIRLSLLLGEWKCSLPQAEHRGKGDFHRNLVKIGPTGRGSDK